MSERDGAFFLEGSTLSDAVKAKEVVSISGWMLAHENLNPDIDMIESFSDVLENFKAKQYLSRALISNKSLDVVFTDSTRFSIRGQKDAALRLALDLAPLFVLGTILLILGLIVASKRELSKSVFVYFMLSFFVAVVFYSYSFLNAVSMNVGSYFPVVTVSYFFNIAVFNFVPVLFLHFFLLFPNPVAFATKRWFAPLLYGVAVIVILLFEARIFFLGQSFLYSLGFLGGAGVTVYRFFDRKLPEIAKAQLRWVCLGVTLFVITFILSYTLPIIMHQPFEQGYLVAAAAFLLVPLSITFAILRYRINDIDLIFDTTIVHGVTIGSLTLLDVSFSLLMFDIFSKHTVGSVLTFTASAWIILFLYRPVRSFFARLISRILNRDTYTIDDVVMELSN